MDCGSVKSLNHPTFGQIATFGFGTPQNFVYSVSCGTLAEVQLEAELRELRLGDLGGLLARVGVRRDGQELLAAGVLAVGDRHALPAFGEHVLLRQRGVTLGLLHPVEVGEALVRPPASSKPGMPGGIEPSRWGRRSSPPRVRRSALCRTRRSIALRTLRLSNGLTCVLSAM